MNDSHDDAYDDQDPPVSKSQVKREMTALQDLGKELTQMSERKLNKLPLPDNLRQAIEEYKRLPNKNEARRRQLQYIGRLMRDADPAPITAVLEQDKQAVELQKRKLHTLEEMRERLINGDTATLNSLIEENPQLDIQHLRQLIRQSQKEQAENKPPAASRKLFRYLRETLLED